jgi:hypothetical protein
MVNLGTRVSHSVGVLAANGSSGKAVNFDSKCSEVSDAVGDHGFCTGKLDRVEDMQYAHAKVPLLQVVHHALIVAQLHRCISVGGTKALKSG